MMTTHYQHKEVRNASNLNLCIGLLLISILTLNSCEKKQKHKYRRTKSLLSKTAIKSPATVIDSFYIRRDSLSLFYIDLEEGKNGDTVGFVSVSDIDALPGNFDSPADSITSLVIPSLKNKKPGDTRYLILPSKYRKRLLTGTGISETDSLFIYDYYNDALLKFPIRSLKAVANLSPYEDATEAMHSARDYMFGFEIAREALKGLNDKYFDRAFVYVGATNPFTRGQTHPIIWKKTATANFPPVALSPDEIKALKDYKLNGTYKFESGGFHYHLQEFTNNTQQAPSSALRLIVTDTTKQVVLNTLYYETEMSSPTAISVTDSDKNVSQWTGKLFKNRPPLIWGFESNDFGCPVFPFIDKSQKYVALNCDNRH